MPPNSALDKLHHAGLLFTDPGADTDPTLLAPVARPAPGGHKPAPHAPSTTAMVDPRTGFAGVTAYSIDGSGNNLSHTSWGSAGSDEARLAPANFAAGTTNTPVDGPNARVISNTIMANDPNTNDPAGRSAYTYAFGQFVDHDLDLNLDQTPTAANTLTITAPADDAFLSPGATISITRGVVDPTNQAAVNSITTYLDLSQVYGSDATTQASLRNADGTMKTSAGNVLPIVDGQFVGGDIRATENPDLTSLDVLFVREHNYWVAKLAKEDPSLSGDQLYAQARAITTAEYQNIVYNEFLPSLLGKGALTPYAGYNPKLQATIFQEFSTAAYRFGHTIISPTESKISNSGVVLAAQDLIAASQEDTGTFTANGGADALLRNLGQDFSQQEGVHINADLLNLLNAGADSIDLGAIDVERERDLGIATLNQTRIAMGMTAYTDFSQITSDATLAAKLQSVYGSVDNLDLFVGGLAETATGGSMVGPTFTAIIAAQFENLRDADRLYFQNQGFAAPLMQQIKDTTLSDLIVRDTDTKVMQADAFVATVRHSSDVASPNAAAPQLVIGVDTDGATIAGSPGVDNTIVAGLGHNQTLTGGGSSDTFVFLGAGHVDTISNFQLTKDVLDFENLDVAATFRDVLITRAADGSALVHLGGNTIDLAGIAPGALSAGNFVFNTDNPALQAQAQLLRDGPGGHF